MSEWIDVSERPPPYRKWILVLRGSGLDREVVPGYRSHTDHSGDHYRGLYKSSSDNDELYHVRYWLDYKDPPL